MSVEEKQEQHQLRQEYLGMIRGQVLHTFSTMKVVDPLGQDVTPDKVYDLRRIRQHSKIKILLSRLRLPSSSDFEGRFFPYF